MPRRSGFSEARKTGAPDRIPGAASAVKLGLSGQQHAVRGEARKEEPGSRCGVEEGAPNDLAVKLGEDSGKEEPVRCAHAGVRPGDRAEAASGRWRIDSGA